MRTEEKEIKRWFRQEQAHILKNKSTREVEIENAQKRRDNIRAKSLQGLGGIWGSSGRINLERTEHLSEGMEGLQVGFVIVAGGS